jgi:membrane protein
LSESLTRRAVIAGQSNNEFLLYVAKRFVSDQCTVRAAGLTYTSLLALVPLLAISFAIFSAFGDLQIKVQAYIYENVVPQLGETVSQHLDGFTKQTGKLTAVGIVFLVATSVMLLLAISNALDAIWRAARNRTLIGRLLVYWGSADIGPSAAGCQRFTFRVSFHCCPSQRCRAVYRSAFRFRSLLSVTVSIRQFRHSLPDHAEHIRKIRDALVGGFTAELLFEILKKSFGYYVTTFPTYETIYGAFATFPIFLIWRYISWLVVLLGAELCATMPEWSAQSRNHSA